MTDVSKYVLCFIGKLLPRAGVRGIRFLRWIGFERFKSHYALLEIENHAVVPQEVSPENSALKKTCSFINRIQIEDCCVYFFTSVGSNCEAGNRSDLNVLSHSGRAENTHGSFLNKALHFFDRRSFFGEDGDRRSGVDDEIERFVQSFN